MITTGDKFVMDKTLPVMLIALKNIAFTYSVMDGKCKPYEKMFKELNTFSVKCPNFFK